MNVGIVQFPGSTGIDDLVYGYQTLLGCDVSILSYLDETIRDISLLVVPGGMAFGDIIRPGVLCRLAPIAPAIRKYARVGRILGVGNGFQILCELGLLRGTMILNEGGSFLSRMVHVKLEEGENFLSKALQPPRVLRVPFAASHGLYWVDRRVLTELQENKSIVLRYVNEDGGDDPDSNIPGAIGAIAAISNPNGNVVGLMLHPERALEDLNGSTDGLEILRASLPNDPGL